MTDHSKYNNGFTAVDFERYHNGSMSPLEMHQLEKAAMEDPFLADALEGYRNSPTPLQDVEYLQAQLQSKTEQGKVVPLRSFTKNQFLRIAALFILLAGGGWAVYQFGFNSTDKDLANVKQPNLPANISADSNQKEADLQQSTAGAATNAETNSSTTNNSTTQTITTQNDGKGTVSVTTQNRHTGKLNNNRSNKKENETANEIAQGNASSISKEAKDEAASLKINSNEANDKLKEDVSGNIASAPQTASPGKENIIVMQRSKTETIPAASAAKKRSDSTHRKPQITFEETEPENGIAFYDDYVTRNIQFPGDVMKKNSTGEVKLTFDINDTGEAVNIKVEKSLGTEYDKEAIRLLQQGPKLKKKKDKKGKFIIRF